MSKEKMIEKEDRCCKCKKFISTKGEYEMRLCEDCIRDRQNALLEFGE